MITAIPVPSQPKPIPNRWVWVGDVSHLCHDKYWDCSLAMPHPRNHSSGIQYLLPGDALTAALAELEQASVMLENAIGEDDELILEECVEVWFAARSKVREAMGEGGGK